MRSKYRQDLIESHIPLIHVVVSSMLARKEYTKFRKYREDFKGVASIGLIEAADRFDPERGTLFRTFASNWMRGRIQDEIGRILKFTDNEAYITDIWEDKKAFATPDFSEKLFDDKEDEYALVDSLAPEDEVEKKVYYLCIIDKVGLKKAEKILHLDWEKIRSIKNKILVDLKEKLKGDK